MTYRWAQEIGGLVTRGEREVLVVYADRVTRSETGDQGEEVERHIPFLKDYTVFNCEQVDACRRGSTPRPPQGRGTLRHQHRGWDPSCWTAPEPEIVSYDLRPTHHPRRPARSQDDAPWAAFSDALPLLRRQAFVRPRRRHGPLQRPTQHPNARSLV